MNVVGTKEQIGGVSEWLLLKLMEVNAEVVIPQVHVALSNSPAHPRSGDYFLPVAPQNGYNANVGAAEFFHRERRRAKEPAFDASATHHAQPWSWRRWSGALLLLILCALVTPFLVSQVASGPVIERGVADFGGAFDRTRPVDLGGRWRAVWHAPGGDAGLALRVPGNWAGAETARGALPDRAHVTYRLELSNLPAGDYRLFAPTIVGASRIAIDGAVRSQRGQLGASPAYYLRPHEIDFRSEGGTVSIAIEVVTGAMRANGILEEPVLGARQAMQWWGAKRMAQEFIILVALILLAVFGLIVFVHRRSDRASLYLALACLSFVPSTLVAGHDNLFLMMFPALDQGAMMVAAYAGGQLGVTALLANIHALFPDESEPRAYGLLAALGPAFAAVLVAVFALGGIYAATWVATALPVLIVLPMAFIVVVVIRAARRRREGAIPLVLGMGVAGVAIVAVAAVAAGEVAPDFAYGMNYAALGILALLFAELIVLAERWAASITATEKTNDDLRQLLEVSSSITSDLQLGSLLDKIVAVSGKIIRAERSSLFLKDPASPVLEAQVAQGVEGAVEPLRVDSGRGLAGYVYATGETLNIADAYADERFNRSVDEATGYRTQSVLTVPINTRDGRRIGVMQAMNREEGGSFTPEDAARMSAFGAQAAVAIDNARLFAEALSARSFDESILRSMAGGVIALDETWKITKLNAAAARILGASSTLLGGLDARTLLQANNPWLTAELEEVTASGEAKVLLDVELVTARAKPSSVNLSIAPLLGEKGAVGMLLVIEDISEGKRLNGAMRRFMPQKVVEQVLERSDELLFGTGCRASVLFADIRNFTSMSEHLTPRETVDMLNEVFGELFEAVAETDGILDKYIGDAVMAVYGVPFSGEHDAANAVTAALRMQDMIAAINESRAVRLMPALSLGVGIATGEVIAGTIGSPKRMDYTVIGDSVNLAARLQELTKSYGKQVIVCERTAAEVRTTRTLGELDRIQIRGREALETIFEVIR